MSFDDAAVTADVTRLKAADDGALDASVTLWVAAPGEEAAPVASTDPAAAGIGAPAEEPAQ